MFLTCLRVWEFSLQKMSHVFGLFRLLLDQLVPVFDVFDVFGVFRLFPEKISHVFDVFRFCPDFF